MFKVTRKCRCIYDRIFLNISFLRFRLFLVMYFHVNLHRMYAFQNFLARVLTGLFFYFYQILTELQVENYDDYWWKKRNPQITHENLRQCFFSTNNHYVPCKCMTIIKHFNSQQFQQENKLTLLGEPKKLPVHEIIFITIRIYKYKIIIRNYGLELTKFYMKLSQATQEYSSTTIYFSLSKDWTFPKQFLSLKSNLVQDK